MSNYTPKVGDRVRRTFPSGTVMEGEIDSVLESGSAVDQNGNVLLSEYYLYETELLHRPVEVKDEVGTCYRHPRDEYRVVVRVDNSATPWMGKLYLAKDTLWHCTNNVQEVIEREGWIEHDIRSK